MTHESLDRPLAAEGTEGRPPRRRWALFCALVLVLGGLVGWGVHRATEPGFPASDSRACAGSSEPLTELAQHVGLFLPTGARHLTYLTASEPPTLLAMAFTTDTVHLQQWLGANHLPAPKPDPQWSVTGPACSSLEDGFADPVSTRTTLPYGTRLTVSVDMDGGPGGPLPTVLADVDADAG
ncbi:hypothetical protein GA0115240_112611 [Streptomyces sp. DvalAA-14]|uniref:hypothetical protein n=1 Tax=unclassified Streptomyces TaxID=2593676 RepID=UPI00081AF613|nr:MULTISPECIES: hypothetical protein [unclassified Streptomyces]MYS19748.1 hypothetical protein [Streptomyces sp. SID4948]SCD52186.1 hypothetical protein GA0115240_112611 [Streptomyces sp. DvalAA-14]